MNVRFSVEKWLYSKNQQEANMSDFFGKLKNGAEKVAFEAEKMTRVSRAKGELDMIKSQIQGQFMRLGEMYYNQRATSGVTGQAYDDLCLAIADLEKQAAAKNEEIQRMNTENYAPQGTPPAPQPVYGQAPYPPAPAAPSIPTPYAPAATVTCPKCGKENQVGVKFCPDCGTSL
jgi:hypothetical protein